jgi:electron-transferring-flavoprotein dehydrogenase
MQRERMDYDVVIVGAGPAGLSAAIRLRQLSLESGRDVRVCVLEKGSEVGAHILSGAVLEPRALNELIPDWKEKGAPLNTPATHDHFWFLTGKKHWKLPTPYAMHNEGNYIISLGAFCRWLATQAEALGVEIYPGFPAAEAIIEDGQVRGVITGDFGLSRTGEQKPGYQPGMAIYGKYTFFAEGCRGSLSEQLQKQFKLREGKSPQTYGIGIKELWEVPAEKHKLGSVVHTIGWPLDSTTYGGSFIYHLENRQVALGLVIGLDYQNPYLNPFRELQRFKQHPSIRAMLEGGRRLSYGARAINEGGWQSVPGLVFPGGALVGCAAGFVNVPKIKGSHTAMKTGMLAAEAAFMALGEGSPPAVLASYTQAVETSWVAAELKEVRNIRPAFRFGLWAGLAYAALEQFVLRGRGAWTFRHHPDNTSLSKAAECKPIAYPAPDGNISFDLASSVYLSNTNHEEDQPVHLRLRDASIPVQHNLALYDAPETRYCPAGVYEIVKEESGPRLHINAQNCVHCKTCDIKDPLQNIQWVTPEGGGGPNYPNM